VAAALAHLHDEAPLAVGFPRTRVLSGLRLDHAVLERALDEHLASGEIVETPAGLQARGRAPALSAGQSALAARVGEAFRTAGFASPRRDELPALLGVPSPVLDPVVGYLLQSGELAAIDERIVLHRDAVERSRQVLEEHIRAHGSLDSGKFKDLLGTTRKYAIPLLEYWDKRGLTRRVGNERVLR
jgi:selenocysteine-specific elongation factor